MKTTRPAARFRSEAPFILGLLLGILTLFWSGIAERSISVAGSNDFSEYWSISRLLIDGDDPWRSGALREVTRRYGTNLSPEHDPLVGHPPWTVLALVPFAAIDVRGAAIAWLVLGAAAAILGVRSLLRTYVPSMPLIHAFTGFALFGSPPSLFAVYAGQWTFLLTGALAACIALLRQGHQLRPAVVTLAALGKPHLFVFAAWALLAVAITRQMYRFAGAAVVLWTLTVALSIALFPQWLDVWAIYSRTEILPDVPRASNLTTLLFEVAGPTGHWIAAGLLLAAVAVGSQFDRAGDAHVAVWLALSPVAALYTWGYDLPLLIVPIVVASGVLVHRSRRLANAIAATTLGFLTAGSLVLWSFNPASGSGSPKSIVALAVLVTIAIALWPQRRARPDHPAP